MDRFGFGIVSYFQMIRMFFFYFVIIGIFALP
jgi:hypothetical protein